MRRLLVVLLGTLIPALVAAQPPTGQAPPDAVPPIPQTGDPMLLHEDPSPLASKLTVSGKLLGNGAYRLSFEYEPGRGVRDALGKAPFERLTFLIWALPSHSLLTLIHLGGSEEEAAALSEELHALSHEVLPWGGPFEAVIHLPHPPESDQTVSVELLAADRRVQVLGADQPPLLSFTASSLFREVSLLAMEGTEAEPP